MGTGTIIFIGLAIFITVYMMYNYRKIRQMPVVDDNAKIVTLTDTNFQHQIKNGITLVDFWAAWCMPCKMMAPILNDVAENIGNDAKIGKINIEENTQTPASFSVRSIPTLIMFKNGKEVARFVGVKSKDFLVKEINKIK